MFVITEIPRSKYRCYVCTKLIGELYIDDKLNLILKLPIIQRAG